MLSSFCFFFPLEAHLRVAVFVHGFAGQHITRLNRSAHEEGWSRPGTWQFRQEHGRTEPGDGYRHTQSQEMDLVAAQMGGSRKAEACRALGRKPGSCHAS